MPRFWPFLIQFSINSSQIYLKCNLRHMVWLAKLVVAQLEVAKWTNKCSKCWLFWECPLMHFKSCLKWVQFPGMGDSGVNTTQRSPKSGFSSLCKKEKNGRRCVNTCISCCYFQPAPRGRMFFFFFWFDYRVTHPNRTILGSVRFFFFFFFEPNQTEPVWPDPKICRLY